MLDQNYVKVYENSAGEITIAYAASGKSHLEIGEIQHIAIKATDACKIADALREVSEDILYGGDEE